MADYEKPKPADQPSADLVEKTPITQDVTSGNGTEQDGQEKTSLKNLLAKAVAEATEAVPSVADVTAAVEAINLQTDPEETSAICKSIAALDDAVVRGTLTKRLAKRSGSNELPLRKEIDKIRKARTAEATANATKFSEVLKDLPKEISAALLIPPTYSVMGEQGRIVREGAEGSTEVAQSPVLLVRRLVNIDDGTIKMEVTYRRNGVWRSTTQSRRTFLDSKAILTCADVDMPVSSDNAAELTRYLARLDQANQSVVEEVQTCQHLGWVGVHGERGFVWGEKHLAPSGQPAIQFEAKTTGDAQIAGGQTSSGTMEGWLEAIRVVRHYPRVLVALYAAHVPPLLRILRSPNFIADYAGRTSVGKTTTLRVAGSVWGNPDEREAESAIGSWDSTRVWLERASSILDGIPIILDDTKRAKNPKMVADMLYTAAQGRGRGRGNTVSTETTRTWRTVLLSSGEAPAISYTTDGGTRARTITLRGLPFGGADNATRAVVDALDLGLKSNFGHAGPTFVRWLIDHPERHEAMQERRKALEAHYAETAPSSVAGRVASYVASIALAGELAHEVLGLPWDYADPFEALWPEIAEDAESASPGIRAFRDVISWAYGHAETFHGRDAGKTPNQGWSGRWDATDEWESIAVNPAVLRRVLTDLGYPESEAILDEWRDRAWIDTGKDRKRYTMLVRVDGHREHLVVIPREVIAKVEGSTEDSHF